MLHIQRKNNTWNKWYIGMPLPTIDTRVAVIQANGNELDLLLNAMKGTTLVESKPFGEVLNELEQKGTMEKGENMNKTYSFNKGSFTLYFANKINDIKAIREGTKLSLLEAKQFMEILWTLDKPVKALDTLMAYARDTTDTTKRVVLTGSRYFGTSTASSDWDYAIFPTISYAIDDWIKELSRMGFTLIHNPAYRDNGINQVYYHAGENIHVQLRYSDTYAKFIKAQKVIDTMRLPDTVHKNKAAMRNVWTVIMKEVCND